MRLEDQLAALSDLGLRMAPDRSIADLEISWPREDYESDPFRLLLSRLGGEGRARTVGPAVL